MDSELSGFSSNEDSRPDELCPFWSTQSMGRLIKRFRFFMNLTSFKRSKICNDLNTQIASFANGNKLKNLQCEPFKKSTGGSRGSSEKVCSEN